MRGWSGVPVRPAQGAWGGLLKPDLRQELRECVQGRVCLLGVGNPDQGDDGLGIKLAESLEKKLKDLPNGPVVIDGGTMPERYIGQVTEGGFDRLVFLDAVEFGGEPGSVLVANGEEMESRFPQVSTHRISLGMLASWVEGNGKTKVRLIGVQPESLKMGQGLTPTVEKTVQILEEVLGDLWCEGTSSGEGSPPPTTSAWPGRPSAEVQ